MSGVQGCQMTGTRFLEAFRRCGIAHERTGFSNPDANRYIERWFRTLKEETVWPKTLRRSNGILQTIRFYNTERPHSALSGECSFYGSI
ncbi:MAG: putative transposase [Clostridia bacterium]|nr:putative transposase [Clostridia bacterium]